MTDALWHRWDNMWKHFVDHKVLYRYKGLILLMLLVVVVVTLAILTNIVTKLLTCEYIGCGWEGGE